MSAPRAFSATTANFQEMAKAEVSSLHWKIMFISGMGFFTDAYDFLIIGVVMAILKTLPASSQKASSVPQRFSRRLSAP
jgi:hypothetical protein